MAQIHYLFWHTLFDKIGGETKKINEANGINATRSRNALR